MRKRTRYALVAAIAALAVPVAVVEADSEQACPEGQRLISGQAGELSFRQDKALPPHTYVEDSVSGSGPDFTVRSDRNSATVEGDPVRLVVRCVD